MSTDDLYVGGRFPGVGDRFRFLEISHVRHMFKGHEFTILEFRDDNHNTLDPTSPSLYRDVEYMSVRMPSVKLARNRIYRVGMDHIYTSSRSTEFVGRGGGLDSLFICEDPGDYIDSSSETFDGFVIG